MALTSDNRFEGSRAGEGMKVEMVGLVRWTIFVFALLVGVNASALDFPMECT